MTPRVFLIYDGKTPASLIILTEVHESSSSLPSTRPDIAFSMTLGMNYIQDDPKHKIYTRYQKGPPAPGFLLVTVASSRDKKKSRRAAEDGFIISIGPPKLTRFERARIIGARSLQLAMGAPAFVPIDESMKEPITLAMTELASEALPISIRRSLPNGASQDVPIKYLL